jgi:hypothetical protein
MGGLARMPLGPVAGLTAIVAAVALALGGAGAALNTAGDATNVRKAKTAKSAKRVQAAPAVNQYEENDEVLVCINGFAEHMVSPEIAAELVASGSATYGPCPPGIFNPF